MTNLQRLASLALLAVVLTACGSSGDGTPAASPGNTAMMPDNTAMPPDNNPSPPDAPNTVNVIPVATPQTIRGLTYPTISKSFGFGFPAIFITLAADDADGSITEYRIITQPAHSDALVIMNDDEIVYDPLSTFRGDDSFEFVAVDNSGAISPPARVSISGLMTEPLALPQDITIQPEGSVNIELEGVDADGSIASYQITTQPEQGMFVPVPSSANTWRYTQNAGFTGTDTFSFTVTDSDGSESPPAVVMVGQPRSISGEPDFRSFTGFAAENPQVRIINTDLYAAAGLGVDINSCNEEPAGSGTIECHGDRTTRTFIDALGANTGGTTYDYRRAFESSVYLVNGRDVRNSNIDTILTALEAFDMNFVYWTAIESASLPMPLLPTQTQSFRQGFADALAYIAEQEVFMVISMENTTSTDRAAGSLSTSPLFCDDYIGLCGEFLEYIIRGPAAVTDKLKAKSVFAGAIEIREQGGVTLREASGAAKEGGDIEAQAIYVPGVTTTSHASAKLGAVAARVANALRAAEGRVPTAERIKTGLMARTDMMEVDYAEGETNDAGTTVLNKRTIRVLNNETF